MKLVLLLITLGSCGINCPTGPVNEVSTAEDGGTDDTDFAVAVAISTGLLLLPIILGAVLGAFFYGSYTRRADRE